MNAKGWWSLLLLVGLLAGCDRVDPNSPQGQRKAIFKQMLHVSEDMGGMLRGRVKFDAARFRQLSVELDSLSQQPWQHFPAVPEDEGDARGEVWQQRARFDDLAHALEQATGALVEAGRGEPLSPAQLSEPVQRVENACRACHEEFRAY